ncbi:hypothetical protein GUJ93_ZPchr0002g25246 [Zizania palustris]|uniref:Uncharacterized protein n=1 Tax=Zizania palustris TaxID=103762 RepID=A0A8J5SDU7_ZIZPA|nr:hypothetical protein GUJ93_ZPchr0002g25246 [Zizania palustris]
MGIWLEGPAAAGKADAQRGRHGGRHGGRGLGDVEQADRLGDTRQWRARDATLVMGMSGDLARQRSDRSEQKGRRSAWGGGGEGGEEVEREGRNGCVWRVATREWEERVGRRWLPRAAGVGRGVAHGARGRR